METYWFCGWILYRIVRGSLYVKKLQAVAKNSIVYEFIATLLTCPLCFGVWFALLLYLYDPTHEAYLYVVTPVLFAGLDSLVVDRVIILDNGG